MIANSRCIACILSKQERKIRKNSDEQKKKEYIHKVLKILYEYGTKECAPMVEKRIKDIYKEYYEEDVDYGALKHRYNQYMLEKEEEIRAHIQENNDIETCIKYVCAGNYIDFGVANKIDDQLLQGLLDKVNELKISKKEVAYLEDELAQAKTLLYITDNCGEIVLGRCRRNWPYQCRTSHRKRSGDHGNRQRTVKRRSQRKDTKCRYHNCKRHGEL